MFKLKKYLICLLTVLFTFNFVLADRKLPGMKHYNSFVDDSIKNEAKVFIQKFIYMIEQSDTIDVYSLLPDNAGKDYSNKFVTDIRNYLNDENKIIKMFKQANIKNPKVWAYFYMAEAYCIIDQKETAYEYYTKAIDKLNKSKGKDNNAYKLFRQRAWCLFEMRKGNRYYIKLAFEDIKEAIILNSKDWLTFYYAGNISCFSLTNGDSLAVKLLEYSKSLCTNSEIQNEISNEIDKIEGVLMGKGLFALGMLFFGGGGGGGQDYYDETVDIKSSFIYFIEKNVPISL